MRIARNVFPSGAAAVVAGIGLLAVCHLATLDDLGGARADGLLKLGVIVGHAGLAGGVLFVLSRGAPGKPRRAKPQRGERPVAAKPAPTPEDGVARRMIATFAGWLAERDERSGRWGGFDQLIREMLAEHLGVARVRCYRLLPGAGRLQPLSQVGAQSASATPSPGIVNHVAAQGREFVAGDGSQGELLERLAAESDERWDWVWPVRRAEQTVGVVAIGKTPAAVIQGRRLRQTVTRIIALFWEHVATLEGLRIAQKTDKPSGVLTRPDFFEVAAGALAESYEHNEPVVVVAVGVEGLRGLDDLGRWSERDTLVETLGCLLARRARADDIVGRFSDDRFVVLLRRLDDGLGRLITEKLLAAAAEQVCRAGAAAPDIRVRAGLAASGFEKTALETLLVAAFSALLRARRDNVALCADAGPVLVTADQS